MQLMLFFFFFSSKLSKLYFLSFCRREGNYGNLTGDLILKEPNRRFEVDRKILLNDGVTGGSLTVCTFLQEPQTSELGSIMH